MVRHPSVNALTPCSPGIETLLGYYGESVVRDGAVDCQVLQRHRFETPLVLTHIAGGKRKTGQPVPAYVSMTTQLCQPVPIGDDFPSGPAQFWESGRPQFGLMMPDVIVDKMFDNSWHDVLLLRRCPILDDVLPESAFGKIAEPMEHERPQPQLSYKLFRRLLTNIKRWAPIVLASVDQTDEEEASKEHLELKDMALWASACCDLLSGTSRLSKQQITEQTINAQMLVPLLRSTDKLQVVAKSAVDIMFPGVFATFWERGPQYTDAMGSVPTRGRLEHGMLEIDVADLLVARDESLSKSRFVFGWVDSSPVGPENWLMHRCITVAAAHVRAVINAQDMLLDVGDDAGSGDEGIV